MSVLETVQEIYAAFGRGDVEGVLAPLADDVQWEAWEDNHAQRAGLDYFVGGTGHDAVLAFFEAVGRLGLRDFQVLDMLASERQVVVEVRIETDRVTDEELHLWTFGDDGKVTRVRHYLDTAKHIAAAAAPA